MLVKTQQPLPDECRNHVARLARKKAETVLTLLGQSVSLEQIQNKQFCLVRFKWCKETFFHFLILKAKAKFFSLAILARIERNDFICKLFL